MDLEEYSELNEPKIMLVALRICAKGAAGPEVCRERLEALLERSGRPVSSDVREILTQRVRAAFQALIVVGLLDPDEQGDCTITGRGEAVLHDNPRGVDSEILMQFPEYRAFIRQPIPAPREDAAEALHPIEPRREYDEGFVAYGQGAGLTENPYARDSAAHLDWENGWTQARDEAQTSTGETRPVTAG